MRILLGVGVFADRPHLNEPGSEDGAVICRDRSNRDLPASRACENRRHVGRQPRITDFLADTSSFAVGPSFRRHGRKGGKRKQGDPLGGTRIMCGTSIGT